MTAYRLNYGNGQVSGTYESQRSRAEVYRDFERERIYDGGAWIYVERWEPGTADCEGTWIRESEAY